MLKMKLITTIAATILLSSTAAFAASAEKGKVAYGKNGCWQCHGWEGQGGTAGPKLARTQLPMEAVMTFVRATNGPMPPYSKKVLSDDDLADIYAFISAQPAPPDPKTIPLLAR